MRGENNIGYLRKKEGKTSSAKKRRGKNDTGFRVSRKKADNMDNEALRLGAGVIGGLLALMMFASPV